MSLKRLAQDANGDLVYTFTHAWSDGTREIRLSPLEVLEKLAALVSLPRVHLVRYSGCLALHSHLRGAIIPILIAKDGAVATQVPSLSVLREGFSPSSSIRAGRRHDPGPLGYDLWMSHRLRRSVQQSHGEA